MSSRSPNDDRRRRLREPDPAMFEYCRTAQCRWDPMSMGRFCHQSADVRSCDARSVEQSTEPEILCQTRAGRCRDSARHDTAAVQTAITTATRRRVEPAATQIPSRNACSAAVRSNRAFGVRREPPQLDLASLTSLRYFYICRNMKYIHGIESPAAEAQESGPAILRLLMKRGPEGCTPTQLGEKLWVSSPTQADVPLPPTSPLP